MDKISKAITTHTIHLKFGIKWKCMETPHARVHTLDVLMHVKLEQTVL